MLRSNLMAILCFLAIFLAACRTGEHKNVGLDKNDENTIRAMLTRYNEAWLRGDSAAILNLFSDSAILIPNGLKPIVGKKEIINFWWPNDSSATKIKEYEIDILEIKGNDNLAYTFENGKLDWSYSKGDFNMSKKQESYEITIFQRTGSGQWTIVKRIWTDLKDAFRN